MKPLIATSSIFELGDIVVTENAQARISHREATRGLNRHAMGDWGDLPEEDICTNNTALEHGSRLISVYGKGKKHFWVITEHDRTRTTILLPLDY